MYKKLLIACLLFLFGSCNKSRGDYDQLNNYGKNQIKFAKYLQIKKGFKKTLIEIVNPQNQKIQRFILSEKAPLKLTKGVTFIKIPIASFIVLSSTHIGMLSKLNQIKRIRGISDVKYVFNPNLIQRVKSGLVKHFGDQNNISMESVIQTGAKAVIYNGFGREIPHQNQLEKLGVSCIPNYDWKEQHPLGKAEWIKLFGYLTGQQQMAERYFNQLTMSYQKWVFEAKKSTNRPKVFSGNLFGDIWFAPAGQSYNAKLFSDANANYVYAETKGTGSLQLSFEKVLSQNLHTNYWLNPGYSSLKAIFSNNPKMQMFDCVKRKNIYCYSEQTNRFWELAAIEPDKVLSDLIAIFHPELNQSKKPLNFYQNSCK